MDRREFIEALAVATAAGLPLGSLAASAGDGEAFYDIRRLGRVSLLHMTDCHAQLRPVHFREPDVNIGVGSQRGRPPHLVGQRALEAYGLRPGSRERLPRAVWVERLSECRAARPHQPN